MTVSSITLEYLKIPAVFRADNVFANLFRGWSGIAIVLYIIGFVIYMLLTYYSFVKYKTVIADAKNLTEYLSQIFYNRPDINAWWTLKIPKNWKPYWASLGYAVGYSMIFYQVVSNFDKLAAVLHFDMRIYHYISNFIPFGIGMAVYLILAIVLWIRWLLKEYKTSKNCIQA